VRKHTQPSLSQPNVLGLVVKIAKAFNEKSGASTEYQTLRSDLQTLERTLRLLQSLKPDDANVAHVDEICKIDLACRKPLQEFIHKINKYEASMGKFAQPKSSPVRSFIRKSQWAVFMDEDVKKLETAIRLKIQNIGLLLAIHNTESVSGLRSEAQEIYVALMTNTTEQRMALADVKQQTTRTKESLERHAEEQTRNGKELDRKLDDVNANVEKGIEHH
jgi:hypothetical protein